MSDDPIDILNRKGAFLQKFYVREIAETGWRVEEEFPVTLAVHRGESSELLMFSRDYFFELVNNVFRQTLITWKFVGKKE
jgi:hypothetical protein